MNFRKLIDHAKISDSSCQLPVNAAATVAVVVIVAAAAAAMAARLRPFRLRRRHQRQSVTAKAIYRNAKSTEISESEIY